MIFTIFFVGTCILLIIKNKEKWYSSFFKIENYVQVKYLNMINMTDKYPFSFLLFIKYH
jgi:hypothetical protein